MTWLHDIPPAKYNGILIGYQVTWKEGTVISNHNFGLKADSYNITGLKKYRSYQVFVAGRTNGGVGVENYKDVMTDEDGEQLCNDFFIF